MKTTLIPVLCLNTVLLLAGCTSDDPRKGGLLGGLIGLGSGSYDERVDNEKAALKAEQARYRGEVRGSEKLDRGMTERAAGAEALKRQVMELRQATQSLEADIEDIRRKETVTRGEVANAEANVALLLDDIDRIGDEQEAHARAELLGADAGPDADPAEFGEPPREQVSDLRAYIVKLQQAVDELKSARERRLSEAGDVAE